MGALRGQRKVYRDYKRIMYGGRYLRISQVCFGTSHLLGCSEPRWGSGLRLVASLGL